MLSTIKLPLFILTCLVILSFLIYRYSKNCEGINCISFQNANNYEKIETYQDNPTVFSGLYLNESETNKLVRLEARVVENAEVADNYIAAEIIRMKSLFGKAVSPYPGEISDTIKCDEEFIPQLATETINGMNFSFFKGYLNARYVFGTCEEKQIAFEGLHTLFYCPGQKKVYQLDFMVPFDKTHPHSFENLISSLQCK